MHPCNGLPCDLDNLHAAYLATYYCSVCRKPLYGGGICNECKEKRSMAAKLKTSDGKEYEFVPRNDFVLISVSKAKIAGLHMPDISTLGEEYKVVAKGPKVEDLEVGDMVMMTGRSETGDWSWVPGTQNLLMTREANVVLKVKRKAEE